MAKQTINIGSAANDGTGDLLRNAFDKCNDNFTELYDDVATNDVIRIDVDAVHTTPAKGLIVTLNFRLP